MSHISSISSSNLSPISPNSPSLNKKSLYHGTETIPVEKLDSKKDACLLEIAQSICVICSTDIFQKDEKNKWKQESNHYLPDQSFVKRSCEKIIKRLESKSKIPGRDTLEFKYDDSLFENEFVFGSGTGNLILTDRVFTAFHCLKKFDKSKNLRGSQTKRLDTSNIDLKKICFIFFCQTPCSDISQLRFPVQNVYLAQSLISWDKEKDWAVIKLQKAVTFRKDISPIQFRFFDRYNAFGPVQSLSLIHYPMGTSQKVTRYDNKNDDRPRIMERLSPNRTLRVSISSFPGSSGSLLLKKIKDTWYAIAINLEGEVSFYQRPSEGKIKIYPAKFDSKEGNEVFLHLKNIPIEKIFQGAKKELDLFFTSYVTTKLKIKNKEANDLLDDFKFQSILGPVTTYIEKNKLFVKEYLEAVDQFRKQSKKEKLDLKIFNKEELATYLHLRVVCKKLGFDNRFIEKILLPIAFLGGSGILPSFFDFEKDSIKKIAQLISYELIHGAKPHSIYFPRTFQSMLRKYATQKNLTKNALGASTKALLKIFTSNSNAKYYLSETDRKNRRHLIYHIESIFGHAQCINYTSDLIGDLCILAGKCYLFDKLYFEPKDFGLEPEVQTAKEAHIKKIAAFYRGALKHYSTKHKLKKTIAEMQLCILYHFFPTKKIDHKKNLNTLRELVDTFPKKEHEDLAYAYAALGEENDLKKAIKFLPTDPSYDPNRCALKVKLLQAMSDLSEQEIFASEILNDILKMKEAEKKMNLKETSMDALFSEFLYLTPYYAGKKSIKKLLRKSIDFLGKRKYHRIKQVSFYLSELQKIGKQYEDKKEWGKARSTYKYAQQMLEELGERPLTDYLKICHKIGDLLIKEKSYIGYSRAVILFQKHHSAPNNTTFEKLKLEARLKRAQCLFGKYETAQGDETIKKSLHTTVKAYMDILQDYDDTETTIQCLEALSKIDLQPKKNIIYKNFHETLANKYESFADHLKEDVKKFGKQKSYEWSKKWIAKAQKLLNNKISENFFEHLKHALNLSIELKKSNGDKKWILKKLISHPQATKFINTKEQKKYQQLLKKLKKREKK